MNPQADLDRLRGLAGRIVIVLLLAHVGLIAAACLALKVGWFAPTLAALACAGVGVVFGRRCVDSSLSRMVCGVALMVSVSVLVGAFDGQKLQVDLHMYYFAALAVFVATCDWRAIVAAAASVAMHHLALNFLLPDLIYPGGSNILRFLLHAVVLLMEAATLAWIALKLEKMFASLAEQAERVAAARAMAESSEAERAAVAARAEAERARNEAEQEAQASDLAFVVDSVATGLSKLSDGDLTYRLTRSFAADYEALRNDFNAAMSKLQDTMTVISANASGIRSSGVDISHASDDLSRRTEQQAASLEETAAALDEVTVTMKKTADGAREASAIVQTATEEAARSREVVRRAVEAMSAIEGSSNQIGQIIGVIDEIAFQTNLLALNAGVEAARAGDAGRGFAVVAQEVRALAQRSAEAAKEIKTLISASSQQVGTGVGLVGETGKTLERITDKVARINAVVTGIAAATQEQASGLQQVNTATNQMDQVTQQNAAMVEQSNAASHALAQEAGELARLMAQFNVGAAALAKGRRPEDAAPRCRRA
jgi:methyl-accepting chemotaxis protein